MTRVKALLLAANPIKKNKLALDEEIRAITTKLRAAEYRDCVELISAQAVRPDDLSQLLLQHKPHIVHFSGHGNEAGDIILADDRGKPKPLNPRALTTLIGILKDNIRVVILNACYSEGLAEALTQVVDCAVGMSTAVHDNSAIVFAAAFYRAIGFGRSVQTAFDLGVQAVLAEGLPGEDTPQLKTKHGIRAADVFLGGASSNEEKQESWPFRQVPAPLRDRCRALFEICDEFRSPDALRSFFHTGELGGFEHCIGRGVTLELDQVISCLLRSGHERPALLDLVEQLAVRYKNDYRGQLCVTLTEDLAKWMA